MKNKDKELKCSICGKLITDRGALSRKDNKTIICSDCGLKEAISDYINSKQDRGNGVD